MSKTRRLRITQNDYILASKRADREDEIRLRGKQIIFRHTRHASLKHYSRKRMTKIETED